MTKKKVICQKCDEVCEKVDGAHIYPHRRDLSHLVFYLCGVCGAYVGTHKNGRPLGVPADTETRKARSMAHKHFDVLWKRKMITRDCAYHQLSVHMGLPKEKTHIGMFTVEQCNRVVEFTKGLMKNDKGN